MRPDDNQQNGRVGTPQIATRSYVHTPPSRDPQYRQQEAAANVVRAQIESIYADDSDGQPETNTTSSVQSPISTLDNHPQTTVTAAHTTTTPETISSAYDRTHSSTPPIQPEQWKAYHSAWQDYYKRYYEGYYTQQVAAAKHQLEATQAQPTAPSIIGSATHETDEEVAADTPMTRREAMQQLRAKLLSKVEDSAKKARKSRHFVPIIATLGVLIIFVFLQYNQVLIANVKAYITPGNIDPQNIIVDPASTIDVGPESRLIIPKINVDTPVFYDIPTDKPSQDKAMENGVAHFAIPGANSHPGQIGNTVLSGHSSNDVFAAGDYKFIFMQLDKLQVGDTIYANYKGKRYTYVVTKKQEVSPTDVSALIYDTDKPVMTLITCTPLGTALRRLLVTAEQVYPTTSEPAPSQSGSTSAPASIPGQGEPTLMERIFGS